MKSIFLSQNTCVRFVTKGVTILKGGGGGDRIFQSHNPPSGSHPTPFIVMGAYIYVLVFARYFC